MAKEGPDKKSFILYMDSLSVLDLLSDEQAGKLLKAFRDYHLTGKTDLDTMLQIAFSQFKNQFDRDAGKYEKIVQQNKEKGKKSAEARAKSKKRTAVNRGKQQSTVVDSGQQTPTDSTDNDNDNDTDSGKEKDSEKDILPFGSDEFTAAWNDFTAHRQSVRHPLTPLATKRIWKKLVKWGEAKALVAIDRAITSGWQDVFEPSPRDMATHAAPNGHEHLPGYNPVLAADPRYRERLSPTGKSLIYEPI